MSNDLFEGASAPTSSDNDSRPAIEEGVNYFEQLVGEGKRYKDPVAAGRALIEKDAFIERLKAEAHEARQELQKRMQLETLVATIAENTSRATNVPVNPGVSTGSNHSAEESQNGLTHDSVQRLVSEQIAQQEARRQQTQNLAHVKAELQKTMGSDYAVKLAARASELGVSREYLNELAAKSPAVLLALVTPQSSSNTVSSITPPKSSSNPVNNGAALSRATTINGTPTKAYYDNLKATNPKAYWSTATQSQMHKDAIKLGQSFFN